MAGATGDAAGDRVRWRVAEVTAVGLVAVSVAVLGLPDVGDAGVAALLFGFGVAQTETAMRTRPVGAAHVDLTIVWTFAAALAVPPVLAAAVSVGLHRHTAVRTGRPRTPAAYGVLACLAAAAVATVGLSSSAGLTGAAALPAYAGVRWGLARLTPAADAPGDAVLELAALVLGVLVSATVPGNPRLFPLVLAGVVLLHAVARTPERAGSTGTDPATGLLDGRAWQARAAERLGPGSAVLILDLDTQALPHCTPVLEAVAERLRREAGDADLVGRFSTGAFVVLLPGGSPGGVAERIRGAVGSLRVPIDTPDGPLTVEGLTVAVGTVVHPDHGRDLATLLRAAGTALDAARRANPGPPGA